MVLPHLGHFLFWVALIRLSYYAELSVCTLLSVPLLCGCRRVSPLLIFLTACVVSGYTVGTQNNFGAYTNACILLNNTSSAMATGFHPC